MNTFDQMLLAQLDVLAPLLCIALAILLCAELIISFRILAYRRLVPIRIQQRTPAQTPEQTPPR
ncbi:hypothetical protein [Musicola keenii]|uniref:hypothetical protein n=1 Tax=Musicola keenii TaxID=2884250 RepID=UPI00178077F1|nr:hypothetical protein [Musicola keenii]